MNAETAKVKTKLAALSSSFDELETLLEPLFSQTLPETLLGLEPLQQAKLQTVLPYLIYDLVFIYLKSRGIDPKTHPVVPELDRIRGYFEKINNAENPPTKRTEIDKEAATRFIKHAIAQVQWKKTAAEEAQEEDAQDQAQSSSSAQQSVPIKVTQKMLDRAAYEKELKAQDAMDEEEEDTLEVYNEGEGDEMDVDADSRTAASSGKGKTKESAGFTSSKKRRRAAVDPFAGYGDDSAARSPVPQSASTKKAKSSLQTTPQSSRPSTPLNQPSDQDKLKPSGKSKKKKKSKKAAT
ncbi:hypothetical protein CVT26_011825 [Gymnopilus dilepis]|uniref:Exosome complex protein n=1 Tax=Gymnopilus dilepis TaxID=231916 RepID=A0A409W9B0_9AGAR|nr:hypothetical protein CVT26_011825 [Gymnopilus dilepis]